TPWERLGDHFAGVRFGIADGVTDPESGTAISGSGLRLGGSDMLSFAPTGGSTSGTLYLRGRSGRECAVRVLGATGRTRVLRYDRSAREWAGL
ncbi:MAG: hypothetical protein NTY02_10110, partial [Acidobacteria bacterium]|nr:hypothetical protein [Acidobacteriota bacterium]